MNEIMFGAFYLGGLLVGSMLWVGLVNIIIKRIWLRPMHAGVLSGVVALVLLALLGSMDVAGALCYLASGAAWGWSNAFFARRKAVAASSRPAGPAAT